MKRGDEKCSGNQIGKNISATTFSREAVMEDFPPLSFSSSPSPPLVNWKGYSVTVC
jgi:hypothetical protein